MERQDTAEKKGGLEERQRLTERQTDGLIWRDRDIDGEKGRAINGETETIMKDRDTYRETEREIIGETETLMERQRH